MQIIYTYINIIDGPRSNAVLWIFFVIYKFTRELKINNNNKRRCIHRSSITPSSTVRLLFYICFDRRVCAKIVVIFLLLFIFTLDRCNLAANDQNENTFFADGLLSRRRGKQKRKNQYK